MASFFSCLATLNTENDGISCFHLDLLQKVIVKSLNKKPSCIWGKPASPSSE